MCKDLFQTVFQFCSYIYKMKRLNKDASQSWKATGKESRELLKICFHNYIYLLNQKASHMDDLLPSHFEGWNPRTRHYFDKLNKEWATDVKFKQLGNCYEDFLLKAFSNHEVSKLSINKNRPNTQGGTYLYKRFVRIFPNGFKPNGVQDFIESFSEGTKMDSNRRDPSDALYNNMGFPIPTGKMGIFIGMSAISHFLNGEKWGIEDSLPDIDEAREFFYEIEDKMEEAKAWALEFTGSSDDFVTVQDSRVQRIRIKLPYLRTDSNNWDDCKINEGLKGLASIFGDLFSEYSIE